MYWSKLARKEGGGWSDHLWMCSRGIGIWHLGIWLGAITVGLG